MQGSGHIPVVTVIVLCIGITVAATFGEFAIGVLGPAFETELRTQPAQLGALMAVMFACSALLAFPSGILTDRVDPRKLVLPQMILAAIAFGTFALVTQPATLYLTAGLVGAVMSLNAPMTNRMVIDFVPFRQRGTAVAWKSVGLQFAALLTGLTFGLTEPFAHWRTTVLVVTAVIIGGGVWAHLRFRRAEPLRFGHSRVMIEASVTEASVTEALGASVPSDRNMPPVSVESGTERLAEPIVWWLIPYSLFTIGAFTCVGAYMVLYATTEVGVPVAAAANASGIAAGISILARFIWVRWLTDRNEALLLGIAAFSSAISVAMLALSPGFGQLGFWVAAVAIGLTILASTPVQQVVLIRNVNPRYVGRISSIIGVAMSVSLAGMPFLISVFIDALGLKSTWFIVVGVTLLGSLTMVLYSVTRYVRGGGRRGCG